MAISRALLPLPILIVFVQASCNYVVSKNFNTRGESVNGIYESLTIYQGAVMPTGLCMDGDAVGKDGSSLFHATNDEGNGHYTSSII